MTATHHQLSFPTTLFPSGVAVQPLASALIHHLEQAAYSPTGHAVLHYPEGLKRLISDVQSFL